jgi:hypothetical protein
MPDFTRGLTIPKHIISVPRHLRFLLEKDGHGITFNSNISAQLRYMFNGTDLGGSYPLSRYKSWGELLSKAIKQAVKLRRDYPNCFKADPSKGVTFREELKKGRSYSEYSYAVRYKRDGKLNIKRYYCGSDNTMTTEKRQHAEKTAWHFRRLYCENLDQEILSSENTQGWQTKKYYQ